MVLLAVHLHGLKENLYIALRSIFIIQLICALTYKVGSVIPTGTAKLIHIIKQPGVTMKLPNLLLRSLLILLALLVTFSQLDAGQCQATTKKGAQCKRNAQSGSIYCWQHEGMYGGGKKETTKPEQKPDTIQPINKPTEVKPKKETVSTQCAATTKKGTRCKRTAKAGSSYCWQHRK